MAIAFSRYVDGTASASSSSASVDLSACSIGHLGFVLISRDYHPSPTTTPSGWNLLQTYSETDVLRYSLYGKILASGDIGTVTWSYAASVRCLATASVYSGAAIASSAQGTYAAAAGYTVDCGSISSSKTWLAQFCSVLQGAERTYDALSGYTERRDRGSVDPDWWHLCADTNGTWGGGACAPDFTIAGGLSASCRLGFIVELSTTGVAAPVLVADRVGAAVAVSWS